MKDFKDVVDYILKNKYVILCVLVVVILYMTGIVKFITEFVILLLLVGIAIFIGKKLQDNESVIKKIFNFKGFNSDENVYYYQEKKEEKKEDKK